MEKIEDAILELMRRADGGRAAALEWVTAAHALDEANKTLDEAERLAKNLDGHARALFSERIERERRMVRLTRRNAAVGFAFGVGEVLPNRDVG